MFREKNDHQWSNEFEIHLPSHAPFAGQFLAPVQVLFAMWCHRPPSELPNQYLGDKGHQSNQGPTSKQISVIRKRVRSWIY